MPKYKSKFYAKALADIMMEGKGEVDKKVLDEFFRLLQKNGDFNKIREIISLTEGLYLKKIGKKKVVLETAREIDKELVKKFSEKGDIVEEKMNPALIAGIRVIINNEKQLDFSLKSKLDKIFEQ